MTKVNKLRDLLSVADIHAARLTMALTELREIFPIDQAKVQSFARDELLLTELLVSRFGKLQDLLGAKLIDLFLEESGETIESLTLIDKINKLERFRIISDASDWKAMREARNHSTHEYPDHPELTAMYLNEIFDLTPKLLGVLNSIKQKFEH